MMVSSMKHIYKTLNILCVDDDEEILKIYVSLFSVLFKKVYTAKDGEEGLFSFEKEPIDIVLTDFKMPKSDGLEMSRKIRKVDASIPIIMVTALESLGMLKEALEINITGFLKKPITSESLYKVFNLAVKSIVAERILKQEHQKQLEYNFAQENLSFTKEKQIAQNDVAKSKKLLGYSCEVVYRAKDVLSGDEFLIREITPSQYFIFVVDGMGKGIPASISAMLCASFVNYMITSHKKEDKSISLRDIISEFIKFMAPNLFDEEIISAHFLCFMQETQELSYASFSMPSLLTIQNEKLIKIKSNNPPISKFISDFHIDKISLSVVDKMLIYTDGINENFLDNQNEVYEKYLLEDFQNSAEGADFEKRMCSRITEQEDDVTFIYLKR